MTSVFIIDKNAFRIDYFSNDMYTNCKDDKGTIFRFRY